MADRLRPIIVPLFVLALLGLLISWPAGILENGGSGMVNFRLGALLISAYAVGQLMKAVRLPLISGYLITGMIAGPYVLGFLTPRIVLEMRLLDDLALSVIALSAGGAFRLDALAQRRRSITLSILFQTLLISGMVCAFVMAAGSSFRFIQNLSTVQLAAMGILLGVTAVARSPSSAIAIISECRASGPFTDLVLGVTVAIDVIIIVLFTLAMTIARSLLLPGSGPDPSVFGMLFLEMAVSIAIGVVSGKLIAFYIDRDGGDLPLLLLVFAFGVAKTSEWLGHAMDASAGVSLHLEPLLICMSAGFIVQNSSPHGRSFLDALDRVSLPVYVLFFCLAGAGLDLNALRATWPLALGITSIRIFGMFLASWLAGTLSGEPARMNRLAWMAYITQAGVAIGLAGIAMRQLPEIGSPLNTIVLAVIAVNQVIGPMTFTAVLRLLGESGRR